MTPSKQRNRREVAVYSYQHPDGKEAFQVVRFEPKDFRVRHRAANRHMVWQAPDCNYPYHLPELLAAQDAPYVFVVEGEKDVETLRALGYVATCNRGGCGNTKSWAKWGPHFKGLTVVVIPDNDDKGREHAAAVAEYLDGHAAQVVLLELPGLDDKGDVTDWLKLDGNTADKLNVFVAAKLEQDDRLTEVQRRWDAEGLAPGASVNGHGDSIAEEDELAEGFEPLPLDTLPPIIARFVEAGSLALPCDPVLLALPALVSCAGAIGNTRLCQIKDSWLEPSILWAIPIAQPSSRKSAAYRLAKAPLEAIDLAMAADAAAELKTYEEELSRWEGRQRRGRAADPEEAADPRPRKPDGRKLLIGDITVETAVRDLRRNPRGLTLLRDEIAGWLGSFGRYSATGSGAAEVACWTECYEGGAYRYDRSTGDGVSLVVPRCSVSVYGTIQPEVMQKCFPRPFFDSGFAYRFILAAPPRRRSRWTDDVIPRDVAGDFAALVAALAALDRHGVLLPTWKPHAVIFDPDAYRRFVKYHDEVEERIDRSQGDRERLLAKGKALCARFALVLHACDQVVDERCPGTISGDQVDRAARLALWCVTETERVYSLIHAEPEQLARERLLEWLRGQAGPVTARELCLSNKSAFKTVRAARLALDTLVSQNVGSWKDRPTTAKGGRPTVEFSLS